MVVPGVRSSGGTSTRNRQVLAIATILIVTVLVTASTQYMLPVQDGPEPPADLPDSLDGETLVVTNMTTWRGVTGLLRRPVSIEAGARLELVDCNLTVLLEDLVLWATPPFWVREEGSLVLHNTTVRLVRDPRLETAAYSSDIADGNWDEETLPSAMSRLVNLAGTERPVLSFDVSWRRQRTDLLVLVQDSPADPLRQLAGFPRADEGYGEWVHREVDLTPARGGVRRIIITAGSSDFGAVLVANVTVREAGHGRLSDTFPTGSPLEDGWEFFRMDSLWYEIKRWRQWEPLMRSYGSLEVDESVLEEPAGLPRHLSWDCEEAAPEEMVQELNYLMSPDGGELDIMGDLTVRDSRVLNVPVHVIDSVVTIERSVIEGDAYLMTLTRSPGTIEDTRFVCREHTVPDWLFDDVYTFEGQYQWDLSVADTWGMSPLGIGRCSFEGGEVGLELRSATARLEDCEFRDVEKCAIWERDTRALDDWEVIASLNGFVACGGYQYMRTHLGRFEHFSHLDYMTQGFLCSPDLADMPDIRMAYLAGPYVDATSFLHVPTLTVDAAGSARSHGQLRVVLSDDSRRWFATVDIDTASTAIDMASVEAREYVPRELMPLLHPEYGPATVGVVGSTDAGALNLSVDVTLNVLDLGAEDGGALRTAVDGGPPEDTVLADHAYNHDSSSVYVASIPLDLTVAPGLQEVALSVWRPVVGGEAVLWNGSFDVYRSVDGTVTGDLRATVSRGEGVVLVDPGASLDIPGPVARDANASVLGPRMSFVLGNGSRVHLSGGGQRGADVDLKVLGAGAFSLEDLDCDALELEAVNVSARMEDVDCTAFSLWAEGSNVTALRMNVTRDVEYLYCFVSSVVMEDSSLSFSSQAADYYRIYEVSWGCLTLRATRLAGTDVNLPLDMADNSTLLLEASTFSALSPEIFVNEPMWEPHPASYHVEVDGCTFADGSVLILPGNLSDSMGLGTDAIPHLVLSASGNRFIGPASGALGDARFMPALVAGSTFEEGAQAYACYGIDVVLVGPLWDISYTWSILDADSRERAAYYFLGDHYRPYYELHNAVGIWPTNDGTPGAPGAITIVIQLDGWMRVPVWFCAVPVDIGSAEVTAPSWSNLEDMLRNYWGDRVFWDD